MKTIYICPKCKLTFSGDGSNVICPSCKGKLKNTIFTRETWDRLTKEEQQKEIEKSSLMPDAEETKQNISGYLPSLGKLYFRILVVAILCIVALVAFITGNGDPIVILFVLITGGGYIFSDVRTIQKGLYRK